MYDDVGRSLGDRGRDRLQLVGTRDCLRWNKCQSHREFVGDVHGNGNQHGQWLHEYSNGVSKSNCNAARCDCRGWNTYLYNDISGTFCYDHNWYRLYLVRTGDRLW